MSVTESVIDFYEQLYPSPLITVRPHPPLLIAIGLLGHLGVDDDHSTVSAVLDVLLHCLSSKLVHLQLILLWKSDTVRVCGGAEESVRMCM